VFNVTVGDKLESGPAVKLLDVNGQPLAGVSVTFGGDRRKVVSSDIDGVARFGALQVDTVAGMMFIQAQVLAANRQALTADFHVRAAAGAVARLVPASGNYQIGQSGATLANQLYVKATDKYNNPVSAVEIAFSVVSGGGSVEYSSATTNAYGIASPGRWTLGAASTQRVSARLQSVEADFDATICTGNACSSVTPNLAFVRDGGVWILSNGAPVLVAQNASRPAWSSDGSRLAFFKVDDNHEDVAICIVAPPAPTATCAPVEVLSREVVSEMRASWAPDGRTLALSRLYYGEGASQLLFLDVATMKISHHGTIDEMVISASWSPDGQKMAIATDAKVYLANAGGAELTVLLPFAALEVGWSPDGKMIGVITLGCDWDCYGDDIGLVDPVSKVFETLVPGQGGFSGLTWSPDGTRLAYTGFANGMQEIRAVTIANRSTEVILTNAADASWKK
jgi:hypothetical protein